MPRFFKGTEKQPFNYPVVVEVRKESKSNLYWIIGALIAILVIGILFLVFK